MAGARSISVLLHLTGLAYTYKYMSLVLSLLSFALILLYYLFLKATPTS